MAAEAVAVAAEVPPGVPPPGVPPSSAGAALRVRRPRPRPPLPPPSPRATPRPLPRVPRRRCSAPSPPRCSIGRVPPPTAAAAARRPRPLNRPLRRPLRRSLRRHRRHTMRRTSTSDDRGFSSGSVHVLLRTALRAVRVDSERFHAPQGQRRQAVPLARGRCASELFVLKAVLDVGIMFMLVHVQHVGYVTNTWHYALRCAPTGHRSTHYGVVRFTPLYSAHRTARAAQTISISKPHLKP